MINIYQEGLAFDDVLLQPQLGVLAKREDASLRTTLVNGVYLSIPIVSSPMQAVTEEPMAYAMSGAGGFGIIHRFQPVEEQCAIFEDEGIDVGNVGIPIAGAAIGVNEGYERWEKLYEATCRVFCLDIAHAHHESVEKFLSEAPAELRERSYMIAGNVATYHGAMFLAQLGVDCIKVGIGPGAACSTREVTGFGVPQLTAVINVRSALDNIYRNKHPEENRSVMMDGIDYSVIKDNITLMADGGIKSSGDIVKALAAGADTVMLGRLLAGCDESPHPGLYWGMASKRVNGHWAPEGVEGVVPKTGSVKDTLKPLLWGVKSGISYGGGTDIKSLRENAQFVKVSPLAQLESGTRI